MRSFFILFVMATTLVGCAHTKQEICDARLPELDSQAENAMTVLRAWEEPSRGLASDSVTPDLSESDRKSWERWAESRLIETQHYIDALDGDPALIGARRELNEIADTLVAFHGYASRAQIPRMILSLEHVRNRAQAIQAEACGGVSWR